MRRHAYYYIAGVAIAAVLLVSSFPVASLAELSADDWSVFAAFVILGLIAQYIATEFPVSGSGARAAYSSLLFIPIFACAIKFPPLATVAAIFIVQVVTECRLPKLYWRLIFNVSQHVITYGVAGATYHWLIGMNSDGGVINIGAFFGMVLVTLFSNQLLVGGFISIRHEEPVLQVLRKTAGPGGANLFYDILVSPFALFVVAAYLEFGLGGLLLVVLPLLMFRYSYQDKQRLQQANKDLLFVLIKTIEMRDPYTSGHSVRVATLSRAIAEDMKLRSREISNIETAATLHDVGKIDPVYSPLIQKPFSLTPDEVKLIQTHAARGAEILSTLTSLPKEVVLAVRHHHERMDGGGYPDGLVGDRIPLAARIIMTADSIDAMLSDRPYRSALSLAQVKAELLRCAGTQFDPLIAKVVATNDTLERAAALARLSSTRNDTHALPVQVA
jgi:putative nucleotidyltransferase with HDIG domain